MFCGNAAAERTVAHKYSEMHIRDESYFERYQQYTFTNVNVVTAFIYPAMCHLCVCSLCSHLSSSH